MREFAVGADVGPALDELEAALRGEHVREDVVLDLRLVAEEVLTNVVKYGGAEGRVPAARVRLHVDPGEVTLEFTDDGEPFDPLGAPLPDLAAQAEDRAIGGMGLHLVRALVDHASYARIDGTNVLTVRKGVP